MRKNLRFILLGLHTFITVYCLLLLTTHHSLLTNLHAIGTPANTVIYNGGDAGTANTADAAGDTIVQWVVGTSTNYATCSRISVTVSTGYAIAALPRPSDQTLTPGSTAYYAYTAFNIGNATDTFTLTVSTFAGQSWTVKIYRDDPPYRSYNGEPEITNTGPLASDTTFYFFVAVIIPRTATDGQSSSVRLTVKNQNGAGTDDDWPDPAVNDDTREDETTTICSAATITMVKGSNRATARPFTDIIVFTSTVTVGGSGTANNVIYRDKLPAKCEYVSGSMVRRIWPNAPVALTDDPNDADGASWDGTNQLITINLGNLTAGTSGYVEFRVKVR